MCKELKEIGLGGWLCRFVIHSWIGARENKARTTIGDSEGNNKENVNKNKTNAWFNRTLTNVTRSAAIYHRQAHNSNSGKSKSAPIWCKCDNAAQNVVIFENSLCIYKFYYILYFWRSTHCTYLDADVLHYTKSKNLRETKKPSRRILLYFL